MVMVIPLVVLAVLSVIGGWVGVPGSLGGSNHFEKFLGPVFHSTTPALNAEHQAAGEAGASGEGNGRPEPQSGHATNCMLLEFRF